MRPRYKGYITVTADHHDGLDDEVQKLLLEGWTLYGNPYVFIGDAEVQELAQAMILHKNVEWRD